MQAIKDMLSIDGRDQKKKREVSLINHFYYPKYGPGQMWEVAAERISASSGEIHKKQNVSQVYLEGNKVSSVSVLYEYSLSDKKFTKSS